MDLTKDNIKKTIIRNNMDTKVTMHEAMKQGSDNGH